MAWAAASSCSMRWHQSLPATIVVLVMYRSLSRTVAGQCQVPKAIQDQYTYRCQEALSYETSSSVQEELHFRDLLVHVLHELNDEVHQLMLQHLLGVEVGDEERNVIALPKRSAINPFPSNAQCPASTYLDRLPPQDEESLRSLRQESRELVHQNMLDLVRLLYPYAHTHTVDRRLDEDTFFLVSRDGQWV